MPPCPIEDDDWERWQTAALQMAEQTRKCVEIALCLAGHCEVIGRVCPEEGDRDETVDVGTDGGGAR